MTYQNTLKKGPAKAGADGLMPIVTEGQAVARKPDDWTIMPINNIALALQDTVTAE